jgi:hypothetical protein
MADLLHMLLSHIFIILGKICHICVFWTIRQIDVSCICYCIFIICRNKSGACICLLSIWPFMDMQDVGYARIICSHRIFYGKFYICARMCLCHILITVFWICRRIVNTYAVILYSPRSAMPFETKAEHECTRGWPRSVPTSISIPKCHTGIKKVCQDKHVRRAIIKKYVEATIENSIHCRLMLSKSSVWTTVRRDLEDRQLNDLLAL